MGCLCNHSSTSSLLPETQKRFFALHLPKLEKPTSLNIKTGQFTGKRDDKVYTHYRKMRLLARSESGDVYLAEHLITGVIRAIKEIDKSTLQLSTDISDSQRSRPDLNSASICSDERIEDLIELQCLSQLDHPHIMKVCEVFESNESYYLATEACEGEDMFTYLHRNGPISEPLAAHIIRQLLSALCYCHSQYIIHRDLKLEHLMIESNASGDFDIKLIGFGAACRMEKGQILKARVGTPYYIAPEVLKGEYNEKCDVWSCGVILYMLLSGCPPFDGGTTYSILKSVKKGEVSFTDPLWGKISEKAQNCIRKLLRCNPKERPSAQECLWDEWILQYHTKAVSIPQKTLENLSQAKPQSELKRVLAAYIVSQLLSKEESKELQAEFQALDSSRDGRISLLELITAYRRFLPDAKAREIAAFVLATVDTNENGFVEYSEFLAAGTNSDLLLSTEHLQTVIAICDRDKSGKISMEELKAEFGDSQISDRIWQNLLTVADVNHDGEIDFQEFSSALRKTDSLHLPNND